MAINTKDESVFVREWNKYARMCKFKNRKDEQRRLFAFGAGWAALARSLGEAWGGDVEKKIKEVLEK